MLLTLPVPAHHAPTEYDFNTIAEIEGTLAEVRWQNPHVRLKVRDTQPGSTTALVWDIEGGSVSILRRTNASKEQLRVGERVRVAGYKSRRSAARMLGTNLLRADGVEFVFMPDHPPRWRSTALGANSTWFDRDHLESSRAGIFRVWSSHLGDFFFTPDREPVLTLAAKKKLERWDDVHDSVARDCEPLGMPLIMDQPYPIEFVARADRILIRIEMDDVVRTVHMRAVDRSTLTTNIQGRSLGHWEGSTLVVETDGVTWPYLNHAGAPLSAAVRFVERFTPTPDGTHLNYSIVVHDPTYLAEPLTMRREWLARPREKITPFDCKKPLTKP